jgi:hypothetical protein
MKRPDVLALVFGVLMSAVALVALWLAFTGSVNWHLIRVAGPLCLVVVGVLGLALSRRQY